MEAGAGLVAGSHNRNELVVIRRDGEAGTQKALEPRSGQICQICEDDVGLTRDGEHFVACNECGFPICRDCYEYERKEGSQVCQQCKTRFKRLKGCARVAGDEEEDDIDDLENEFNFQGKGKEDVQQQGLAAEAMFYGHLSYGCSGVAFESDLPPHVVDSVPQLPLLTNGHMDDYIPPEQHALVPSVMGSGGKRVHPLPFSDSSLPVQPRSMDPSKDLAAYGYGSVAWKERMESWKQKQEKLQTMRNDDGGKDWENDGDGPDLPL